MLRKISIIICIFFFAYCSETSRDKKNYNCLLDKVSLLDTLYLTNREQGSFSNGTQIIKIYNRNDSIYATYKWKIDIDTSTFLTKPLNDSSIVIFQRFERVGKTFKSPDSLACSSTHTYEIRVKAEEYKFIDKSCSFDLFERFLENTFVFPRTSNK